MEPLELIAVFVLATVVQLPFHVAVAFPWLASAVVAALVTKRWRGSLPRVILIAGLLAIGLAPAYGFHLSMMPAYSLMMSQALEPSEAVIRILETWAIFVALLLAFRWFRTQRRPQEKGAADAV